MEDSEDLDEAGIASGVERFDLGGKNVVDAKGTGDIGVERFSKDLILRTGLEQLAGLQEADVVSELEALFQIMGDEDESGLGALARVAKDLIEGLTKAGIQAAGGFVEQQEARFVNERTRQSSALFLTAGELRRLAISECAEFEGVQQIIDATPAMEDAAAAACVSGKTKIGAHGHVREEGVVLKDIAAPALLRRKVNVSGGVEVKVIVDENAAVVGTSKASEAIEGERLTRSAGSPENDRAGVGAEMDIECEAWGIAVWRMFLQQASVDHWLRSGGAFSAGGLPNAGRGPE